MDKRTLTTAIGRYVVNPIVKAAVERGIAPPSYAILETTGRRSGRARRTPVGNGLDGDTFWIVAEHGRRAAYVRNIEADGHVRVKVGGRWRDGVACVMPEDDPRARQRRIGLRFNAAVVRAMGTDLLTVRVDLAPAPAATSDDRGDERPVRHVVGDLRPAGQGADPGQAPADDAEVEGGDRQAAERPGGDGAPLR
jgi:deazaflavin-dependent oxidoreductase (nitroreductase family)